MTILDTTYHFISCFVLTKTEIKIKLFSTSLERRKRQIIEVQLWRLEQFFKFLPTVKK